MAIQSETELYPPVKTYLESLGYEVKGEVKNCDLVAIRGDEPPLIVELKKSFTVPLLVQGIDRLRQSDMVYIAFEKKEHGRAPHQLKWSELRRLCQMLGLGLMTVRFYKRKAPLVEVVCHPESYMPRKSPRKTMRLVNEFKERSGDYNVGGSSQRKLVTAYREKALHCAYHLKQNGPMAPRQLKELTGHPNVPGILQHNYYLWFRRVSRGIYEITPQGEKALKEFAYVVEPMLGVGTAEKANNGQQPDDIIGGSALE
ncbi:DUF2161 domain-containing phosphodiesterase [Paenibacillus sp. J2TS4]|uniref:DUF2161 domain-containing phosphodiesterase n=1 Tax=Paenibacillus sp. J2TS4 TaxID=2807194 RepID=UPI001B2405DE|nr:DUF2161 family putative PD-(D/E)XK-type phosphodiesterase [Paenibacillus sp. J2TS4]GIP34299.1 hypothetical protein J2TS4_35090 [Paenibacillus sp. J2TS4]